MSPDPNTLTYTEASLSDLSTLISCRIAFLTSLLGEQTAESKAELERQLSAYFQDALNNRQCILWLAKDGDQVAGIGGVVLRQQAGNFKNPQGRVGYIFNMYTLPGYRRRGISSSILSLLIVSAKAAGTHHFELHSTEEGEPVYQKAGFYLHHEPTYRL